MLLETSCRAAVVVYHGCGLLRLFPHCGSEATATLFRDSLGLPDAFPTSFHAPALHRPSLRVFFYEQANWVLQRTWGSLRSPHAAEHCYVRHTHKAT